FGGVARYFSRVPNDLAARQLSGNASVSADFFDANLTRQIPNGVLAGPPGFQTPVHYTETPRNVSVDSNAKLPYTDALVAGSERERLPEWWICARFTFRRIGRVVEDVGQFPVVAAFLGIPGADNPPVLLTNPTADTPIDPRAAALDPRFVDPVHEYSALEFI